MLHAHTRVASHDEAFGQAGYIHVYFIDMKHSVSRAPRQGGEEQLPGFKLSPDIASNV